MPLSDAITPLERESGVNRSIVSTNPIDETGEFCHLTLFGPFEPIIQDLCLAFFQQQHKFLAQPIDGVEIWAGLTDMLDVMLFLGGQFLGRQNHQKRSAAGRKTSLPLLRKDAWFSRIASRP